MTDQPQTQNPTQSVSSNADVADKPLTEDYVSNLLKDIQKEIQEEESKKQQEAVVKDKTMLKTIVKQIEDQKRQMETDYKSQLELQKKQVEELNQKLSKISEGSKSAPPVDANPLRATNPNAGKDKMRLIKEDLVKKGILFPEALNYGK
jgi:YesN/AraC family two-component response regulator